MTDLKTLDRALKALADPTRLRILGLLRSGEICVCHIHETLKITQTKASRHLAYLRRAGLVSGTKRGLWVHYQLAPRRDALMQTVLDSVEHCIAHLPSMQRDAVRLEQRTGCCVAAVPPAPAFSCCETRT